MNTDSLRQAISDSLIYELNKSEGIYKTILTEQHETYELIVYIWIAITAVLISGTLFWNFYIANKKIEGETEKRASELKKLILKFKEEIFDQTNKIHQEFELKINDGLEKKHDESTKYIEDKFKEETTEINLRFAKNEADSHRSFADIAQSSDRYWTAVTQCTAAIVKYQETGQQEMVSRCLNVLIDCLSNKTCKQQCRELEFKLYDSIKNIISSLPGYLEDRKRIATKLLDSYKEEEQ